MAAEDAAAGSWVLLPLLLGEKALLQDAAGSFLQVGAGGLLRRRQRAGMQSRWLWRRSSSRAVCMEGGVRENPLRREQLLLLMRPLLLHSRMVLCSLAVCSLSHGHCMEDTEETQGQGGHKASVPITL